MKYMPDHYHTYDELTELVTLWGNHSRCTVSSAGESAEGRQLWVLAITATGDDPDTKPAFWLDGNTHASEVTGCAACLYMAHRLLNDNDETTVDLLNEFTFYILPRISPDGAEYYLNGKSYVRSVPRRWPDPETAPDFELKDLTGDGETGQMRQVAEDGSWVASTEDARVMRPRKPWDKGPFYHLFGEGIFTEPDAWKKTVDKRLGFGLDFNRNYPHAWRPPHSQHGAGDYPLSEPETRAVVDFLRTHMNVGAMLTHHTFTGVLLRPFTDKPDDKMPGADLSAYKMIGDQCEVQTGYACASVFHDFLYDNNQAEGGVFDDWAYEGYGVLCFTMELWDPYARAGIDHKDGGYLRIWKNPTEDDELKLIRWNDSELDGEGFADWAAFEHPQIGAVEIGGWRRRFSVRNPPAKFLEQESEKAYRFTLDYAQALPRPRLELVTENVSDSIQRITARLTNAGYLPTYGTEIAKKNSLVKKLHLEFETDGTLVEGDAKQRVEHLGGVSSQVSPAASFHTYSGRTLTNRESHSWLVESGTTASVVWRGDRIGRLESNVSWSNV